MYLANSRAMYAISSGRVARPNKCERCKKIPKTRVHAHHCDYGKPLDLMFLCAACHSEWHKRYSARGVRVERYKKLPKWRPEFREHFFTKTLYRVNVDEKLYRQFCRAVRDPSAEIETLMRRFVEA